MAGALPGTERRTDGRQPSRFALDWALFALLLVAYEVMRGAAARIGRPVHDLSGVERALLGGYEPTVVLQAALYRPRAVAWIDVLGTSVYFLHFVVPVAVGLVLWLGDRARFRRFGISLVAVCGLAFAVYLVAPTTPPWLADPRSVHHVIDETLAKLRVPTPLFWVYSHRDYNLYAAFPSLHAAFPLLAAINTWGYRRWLGVVLGGWTLLVWLMVVYLGEHLVVDVAGGVVAAFAVTAAVAVARRLVARRPRALLSRSLAPVVVVATEAPTSARHARPVGDGLVSGPRAPAGSSAAHPMAIL